MLPKLGKPFTMKEGNSKKMKRESDDKYLYSSNLKDVGLRILVHRSPGEPNIVVKQSIRLTSSIGSIHTNSDMSCFLKSCFLCNKNFSPHEDIYMYRGDQGYCSIECRKKQIEIDERIELEASTKQILASFRRCNDGGPSETCLLLDDLRQRRHNRNPRPRSRVVVS